MNPAFEKCGGSKAFRANLLTSWHSLLDLISCAGGIASKLFDGSFI